VSATLGAFPSVRLSIHTPALISVVFSVALLVLSRQLLRYQGAGLSDLGLVVSRARFREFGAGFAVSSILFLAIAVVQALLPALRRSRGHVVLMGSIGGRSALPFLGPYAASKHALEAFADVLRVELEPWGIGVSIVEPASVRTAIWTKGAAHADALREATSPAAAELYAERMAKFNSVALKRGPGVDPDVVAKVVEHALTASRPKARYVIGRDAHLRAWIERLPTRLRDRILARALTE
jgi:NAD(P)-dependent dehydrogenase (short-subunit alcohol dehydrogenase family)